MLVHWRATAAQRQSAGVVTSHTHTEVGRSWILIRCLPVPHLQYIYPCLLIRDFELFKYVCNLPGYIQARREGGKGGKVFLGPATFVGPAVAQKY